MDFCRVAISFITLATLVGCSSMRTDKSGYQKGGPKDYSTLPEEYSMKEDRSELEKLRAEVPEEIKKDNDEFAFIMKLMGETKDRPEKIRDRFNSEVRKRREKFTKLQQKDREGFNNEERKSREAFLKKLKEDREDFVDDKPTPDDRKEFFSEQETKRREFFADQSDKRRDFESQMRERQTTFDAYIRETTSEFNSEHRAYGERFRQWEKEKKEFDQAKSKHEKEQREQRAAAREAGQDQGGTIPNAQKYQYDKDLEEFNNIPSGGSPLRSGDDGN